MLRGQAARGVVIDSPRDEGAGATDEAACVARAKADRQAFAVLYRRYVDPVYRYCHRRLGNREAAEDATSAVFLKALDALSTCRDDAFRSWLFSIAHNVVADRRRAAVRSEPLPEADDLQAADSTPEEAALEGEAAETVAALLSWLTPEQAAVVELRLAGLTGVEIAAALGRSHAAVRMLQSRAIARLRALFAEGQSGPPTAARRELTDDRS